MPCMRIMCAILTCTLILAGCPAPATADELSDSEIDVAMERLREDLAREKANRTANSMLTSIAIIACGAGLAVAGNVQSKHIKKLEDSGFDVGDDSTKWTIVQWTGVAGAVLGFASFFASVPRELPAQPTPKQPASSQ